MKTYFVYILKCYDESYYTGFTNNLELRFNQHQQGINSESYTFNKRPLELVYYACFKNPNEAISFEKRLKGWSRKKKEAFINSDWERLKDLSICVNETHHSNKKGFDSAQPD